MLRDARRGLSCLGLLALAAGCGDKAPSTVDSADTSDDSDTAHDTSDSGGAGGGDGGGTGGGGSGTPQNPSISEADSWCYEHNTGDTRQIWVATATASDPQGTDTLAPIVEGVIVLQGSTEIATYSIVCGDTGACTATWNQDTHGISCSNASAYTILIRVSDEDGNWSDPSTVTGRQGTSAEG